MHDTDRCPGQAHHLRPIAGESVGARLADHGRGVWRSALSVPYGFRLRPHDPHVAGQTNRSAHHGVSPRRQDAAPGVPSQAPEEEQTQCACYYDRAPVLDQCLRLDVTDQKSVDEALRAAGEIDVFVSNAGATVRASLENVPISEVEALFQLNTFGPLRVVQGVLPAMRERGAGRLVFVSSIQGRLVVPIIGPYAASKWALEAFAETLAVEAGHFGVKVSILQPGSVSSGAVERAKSFFTENDPYTPLFKQFGPLRGTSIFETITPEEVATAVADTIEQPDPPRRVPVGAPARTALE
ncbi:SDR family NAD(P)-dependent oxidoreductase, partial [Streptomyces sp. NPDC058418]|uniref:SDR family NAD(P)-dependent oxidoreductase n=1 Tax=Streptomyces sp. NPDC058418 TaxID=3346488 RepID=UPI0036577701